MIKPEMENSALPIKALFVIAHYFNPGGGGPYGSLNERKESRADSFGKCITAINDHFSGAASYLTGSQSKGFVLEKANGRLLNKCDIVVCAIAPYTLFDCITVDPGLFTVEHVEVEPLLMEFEAQRIFRERSGLYTHYVFLEDDIIIHDPLLFLKLNWFYQIVRPGVLLQPHRYEVTGRDARGKHYIDGDTVRDAVARFYPFSKNNEKGDSIEGVFSGTNMCFSRAANPHAGCYFLSQAHLDIWMGKPWFYDRDISFIGPLESAATLGILKTFEVYKPDFSNASFFEVQHCGEAFLAQAVATAADVVRDSRQNGDVEPLPWRIATLEAECRRLKGESRGLLAKLEHEKNMNKFFQDSTFWKMTRPLRKISGLLKGFLKNRKAE